jgi:hypothetical protein
VSSDRHVEILVDDVDKLQGLTAESQLFGSMELFLFPVVPEQRAAALAREIIFGRHFATVLVGP